MSKKLKVFARIMALMLLIAMLVPLVACKDNSQKEKDGKDSFDLDGFTLTVLSSALIEGITSTDLMQVEEANGDTIKDVCGALTGLGCYVENAAFAPEAYYPATGEYFTVEYGVYHIIGVCGCIENESIFAVVSSTMDGSGSAAVFEITEGTVKVVYGSLRS